MAWGKTNMNTFKRLISKILDILIPERVLYRKKLRQLEFKIFPSIVKKIDEITPEIINRQIDNMASIDSIAIGDKNNFQNLGCVIGVDGKSK